MKRVLAAGVLSVVISITPVLAHATISFELGNNPQPDEENVLLNTGAVGSIVVGTTNQTGIDVNFSSTTDTLSAPSNGQARVEAEDGAVNNITVSVPGGTYIDLIVNPFNGEGDATITVIANEPGGGQTTNTFLYTLGNGQNFVTIVASGGETIASTTIDAPGGFADLRQPRISGAELPGRVPEPGIALLLGSALGAVALYRGRTRR
jgi:hypothetical protein